MSLRVYALVPAASRITTKGAAGEPTRMIGAGGVAAVVAAAARPFTSTRANLVAYHAVMERMAARASAMLPVRFNTMVADDEEMQTILTARGPSIRRALTQVRGRVQMTLRLPMAPVGQALSGSPRERNNARATGASYLRARAAAFQAPEFDGLRPAVARWIRAERVERRGQVVSIYHLVPRGAVPAYRRALETAGQGRVVVSGPFPPFAFAGDQ